MTSVLVTTATGKVGREVVKLLLTEHKDAFKVKVAVRDVNSEKAKRARAGGAEPVPAQTEDPETLIAALEGVEKLVFISPSVFTHQDITLAWINAIQERKAKDGDAFKLKHIIRLSFATCDDPKFLFAQWHALNEVFLKTTDIKTTFVRSSLFSQNIGAVFSHVVRATKSLQMLYGDFATSYIDTRDVARVLVQFVSAKAEDAPESFDVVGAVAVKNSDIAAAISKAIGLEIPYTEVSADESHAQLAVLGLPDGMVESVLDTLQVIAKEPSVLNTGNDSFKTLVGRDPIPVAQYIQEHADLFKPPQ